MSCLSRRALPALALLLAASLCACSRSEPETTYARAIESARASKDEMLRTAPDSPIARNKQADLLPLEYFAPDEGYRVPAGLGPGATGQGMEIPTSTGQKRHMAVVGALEFTLKGQRMKLTAFVEEGSNGERLFIPFTDETTGKESYGGGRYLDLDRSSSGIYAIDFNTAYNPYCAYNITYDCPVPPPENRLPIAIRAGEKKPRGR
jgi:uncharacterized protein